MIPKPDFNNFEDKLWSRSRIYRPVNSEVHLEVLDSKRWTLPSYQAWGQVMSSPVILTLAGESSFSCLVLRWMLSKFVKYVFHSCFCSRLRVYLSDRDMVCTTRSGYPFQPFPTYILLTLILCQRQHMTVKEKGFAYFVSPLGCHLIVPGLLKRSLIDVERPQWHAMTANNPPE